MNHHRLTTTVSPHAPLLESLKKALAILAIIFAPSAWPQWESTDRIASEALAFARTHTTDLPGNVDVELGKFDRSVRVPRCYRIHAYLPPNARLWGRTVVGVRCEEPAYWSLQVPVVVRIMAAVVVTAKPVARRQLLSESDLALRTMDVSQLPLGLITKLDQAIGARAVAALAAGTPLRGDMLKAAPAVVQGQTVKLLYKGSSFNISGEARALGDASIGDQVAVRVMSGKIVRGIAVEKGVVQVQ